MNILEQGSLWQNKRPLLQQRSQAIFITLLTLALYHTGVMAVKEDKNASGNSDDDK